MSWAQTRANFLPAGFLRTGGARARRAPLRSREATPSSLRLLLAGYVDSLPLHYYLPHQCNAVRGSSVSFAVSLGICIFTIKVNTAVQNCQSWLECRARQGCVRHEHRSALAATYPLDSAYDETPQTTAIVPDLQKRTTDDKQPSRQATAGKIQELVRHECNCQMPLKCDFVADNMLHKILRTRTGGRMISLPAYAHRIRMLEHTH